MPVMKKFQKILPPIIFILAWTVLWSVAIGVAAIILYCRSIEDVNLATLKKIAETNLMALPASLFGSIISHPFANHWFPRFKAKRIFLSLFWGVFWSLYLTILICFGFYVQGMNYISAAFLSAFFIFAALVCLGPPIVTIAYCASFAPMLRPKNYRDWT
jgi:hypothetical protein